MSDGKAIRAFLVCSGLGRVYRGYESFVEQTFRALRHDPTLELTLYGAARSSRFDAVELRCLDRAGLPARWLGRLTRRGAYFAEQATFVASLTPHLLRHRPDVVICSDRGIIDLLWTLRRLLRLNYKILASNGGPIGPPFFRLDFAQHLIDTTFEECMARGYSPARHMLLPYGFEIPPELLPLSSAERATRQQRLGLPVDAEIVLAAGAVNASQKRMDYIVREVAAARRKRSDLYLIMLGQQDAETPHIRKLADDLLGAGTFMIRTVESAQMQAYYAAADTFVLASLAEGFGRVLVEACAAGLTCVVHEHPASRFILGPFGQYLDLTREGALSEALNGPPVANSRMQRHGWAYGRFSWDRLRPAYVEMITRCAGVTPLRTPEMGNT